MSDFHLSFAEIESMPLDILLDLEVVDSKVIAAFDANSAKRKSTRKKRTLEDYI